MSIAAPMTVDEFLALPDDGVERWLIDGVLFENPASDIGRRNRHHASALGNITGILGVWLSSRPKPRGEIGCGDVGVILNRNPDTMVGIDLVYVDAETADRETESTYFESPPILAVVVLSYCDAPEDIATRVRVYLDSGVKVVWIVDPYTQEVTIHRSDAVSLTLASHDTLTGDPELPGFSCPVARFFR